MLVVPTPGHTPTHVSVVVLGEPNVFLAGDTSYTQSLFLAGKVDGVSPKPQIAMETHGRIRSLAAERPLVYLPSHDPDSARRLAESAVIGADALRAPQEADIGRRRTETTDRRLHQVVAASLGA